MGHLTSPADAGCDMSEVLTADALTIGYGGRSTSVVASELTLGLKAGELVCLMGANGVGKSTLLRTLVGMLPPLGGRVLLGGDSLVNLSVEARAQRVAVVLTDVVDVGHMPVLTLVGLGRHPYTNWSGRLRAQDVEKVEWALKAVDAWVLRGRYVDELSDGERQRVMIARALAQDPDVIVLDEPTAFLDLPRRLEVFRTLRSLAHDQGRAVLVTTHDLDLAMRLADRLWLFQQDGGLCTGIPEALAMNGAIGALFSDSGTVVYDSLKGTFELVSSFVPDVCVSGEGLVAEWTRRLVRRLGFGLVSREDARLIVDPPESHEAGVWTLTTGERSEQAPTIEDLVIRLHALPGRSSSEET